MSSDPGSAEDTRALATLSSAYNLKGDHRQAEACLKQAQALEPENQAVKASLAGVHHERATVCSRVGRPHPRLTSFGKPWPSIIRPTSTS